MNENEDGVLDIIQPLVGVIDVNHVIEYLSLDPNNPEDITTLNEIIDLCNRGYEWGRKGYWPDLDYSSDADWCYGPGANIQKLEGKLDIDDAWIFEQFINAHGCGLGLFNSCF
jgi:hypothetical protein